MNAVAMRPYLVAALLLLFLLLASLYNAAVPLGEGPDEPGHMDYVLFLARERRLPVQSESTAQHDVHGEGHQPPLAYVLLLPAVFWLPQEAQSFEQSANPAFLWNDSTEAAAFVRASYEYWPWQGVALGWHLARAISSLVAAVVVYCTWRAAQHYFAACERPAGHAAWLALSAAALVALNPQVLFTAALVTNDTLLAALSAGLLWLSAAAASDQRPAPRYPRVDPRIVQAGLLFGLALLTKQSALLLLPLLLWLGWRVGGGRWRLLLWHTLCWGSVALLLAGWWYLRNWQLYGDPMGLSAFQAVYATQAFDWRSAAAWYGALVQLHESFWARFGWLSVRPPALVRWCYSALVLLALGGLACSGWLAVARRVPFGAAIRSAWLPLLLLPLLALAWVFSFALVGGLVAWQGRMLFPALPAIAILLAWGLSFVPLRLSFVLHGVLLLLALYLPFGVIAPTYVWRTLPPAAAQERIGQPFYARYAQEWERGIELRGWSIGGQGEGQTVRAGETISVRLLWHALERVPEDWTVFVHLVDDEGEIVAESNNKPQQGQMPLPLWTPGDWLEDTHVLSLPADLRAGRYWLRVGLYLPWQRDPRAGHRQQVWASDGTKLGDLAEIGSVQVR